jgi:hypothetical protein
MTSKTAIGAHWACHYSRPVPRASIPSATCLLASGEPVRVAPSYSSKCRARVYGPKPPVRLIAGCVAAHGSA